MIGLGQSSDEVVESEESSAALLSAFARHSRALQDHQIRLKARRLRHSLASASLLANSTLRSFCDLEARRDAVNTHDRGRDQLALYEVWSLR